MVGIGEAAALVAALCWTGSALFFEAAGKRIGSLSVNLLRLLVGLGLLAGFNALASGHAWPVDAGAHAWTWLSVSGIVGFTLGDLFLFKAFVVVGPRVSMVVMSLVPPMAGVMGWLFLGEVLSALDIAGMSVTLAGVTIVVLDRTSGDVKNPAAPSPRGVLLALGGALGQAGGLVLSKYGMGDMDAFVATQIRVIAGSAGFALLFVALGWWPRVFRALRDLRALATLSAGAFVGPFLGVSLSLVAIRYAPTGVAATLMALSPVMVIPIVVALGRERVRWPAALGALLSVAGVSLLVLF